MSFGYHNHIVLPLGYQGDLTGTAVAVAIAGPNINLPFKMELVGATVNATALVVTAADSWSTSQINILANGVTVLSGKLIISDGAVGSAAQKLTASTYNLEPGNFTQATGTITSTPVNILGSKRVHEAGTIFSLTETTSTNAVVHDPKVQLWFRSRKA
jgi:hypothetical protein